MFIKKQRGLRIFSVSLFFYCILLSSTGLAQDGLLTQSSQLQLSEDPFWLKLLRYEKRFYGLAKSQSEIKSDSFFLSPDGKINPDNELRTTINGFLSPVNEASIDQHAICRFPARYKWVKKKLNWSGRDEVLTQCKRYQKWTRHGKIKSISLFFATGYFDNPASYFGHALLRFNTGEGYENLLDTSVNYGALTSGSENPVVYVTKGLLGGFDASFTNQQFYQHSHNYSETELRDLWEYRLNLTQEEVEFLVDHTWELLSQKFSYKFLSDNCAYRMAELLEIVYDTPIIPHNPLYTMPVSVFEGLAKTHRANSSPLITEVLRLPSRQSRMADKYLHLPKQQQQIAKNIINSQQNLKQNDYLELDTNEKIQLLDSMTDYFSYRSVLDPSNMEIKKRRQELLLARLSLPASPESTNTVTKNPPPPHESQNSFMLRLGTSHNDVLGNFNEFTVRPALYDMLSPTVARPQNTGLEITNLKLRFHDDRTEISELDIFRVHNFSTPLTDLPGEHKLAWKVTLGVFPQQENCFDCSVAGLSGGAGKAIEIFSGASAYALIGGTLQTELNEYGTAALVPEGGVIAEILPQWKLHLSVAYKKFINGEKDETSITQIENRIGNSPNWDIRLSFRKTQTAETSLSTAVYF